MYVDTRMENVEETANIFNSSARSIDYSDEKITNTEDTIYLLYL